MTDVTDEYGSPDSPAEDQPAPGDDAPGVVPAIRDQDPGETESQQLTDDFPDALPRYMKIELRRRSPEEQRLYLLAKLAERQADLVKECKASAGLRSELHIARAIGRERTDEVQELRALVADNDALRERMARLLTEVASALKGEPGLGVMHDWSDLPALAVETMGQLAARTADLLMASAECQSLKDWRASAQEVMAAQRAEIERLEVALGQAREEVDKAVENAQSWQLWGEGHKRRADAAPDAVAALNVRTGDRVAVLIPGEIDPEFQPHLAKLFPGVEIIVLGGVVGAIRADALPTEPAGDR